MRLITSTASVRTLSRTSAIAVAAVLALASPARAGEPADGPSADELIRKYDAAMSPVVFDSLMSMVVHRQDGTTRTYKFRALKHHDDKVRTWFFEPAASRGQEMLKVGDNLWVYMPNLKRALRIAARDSFQGGDFANGDIMRVNYVADYKAARVPSADPQVFALDLKAKTAEATYDRIKLWMSKNKQLPVKAEYYAASGKLLRTATFEDVKSFRGLERPSRIVMHNELATKRYTEITALDLKVNVQVLAQTFVLDDLGR